MKASSIIDNVINIKKDMSKVNKNSDNSFNRFMDSETKNINNNFNDKPKSVSENNFEKVEEAKTIFKKIENVKNSEIKPQEIKEVLSDKLPKKLEKLINFLAVSKEGEIPEKDLSELKSLVQELISNLKKLKEENNPKNKEKLLSNLKEINQKLKDLFPEKDINLNLLNFKDTLVIDIKVGDRSLVFSLEDKKINIYKYQPEEKKKNLEDNNKSKNDKNININNEKELEKNSNSHQTKESKGERKTLLSLIHEEKISNNNLNEKNNILENQTENNDLNKNSLIKIQNIISDFIKNNKNNTSKDKTNDAKIKLSQMLVNKNDFIKLSKNVSYFDLTDRIKSKINSENNINNIETNRKSSIENKEMKPIENKISKVQNLKDNNIEEKNNEKMKNNKDDVSKINMNNDNIESNKTNKTLNNEISSNGNIKINPTNNSSSNISINRTSQPQTLNLNQFNAHIQEIVNQRATENTFREIVTLKVNPPDLGNVDVEIAKSGKSVSISIMTENENAKSFISRTIQSLIGSLRDQGFNPINVKVETAPEPDLMDTEKQDEQNNEQEQQNEENNEERKFENILRGEENV